MKADVIVRKDRPYSRAEFERRRRVEVLGVPAYVVSPEDAILSKLEWSRESLSGIQRRDALGVALAQRDLLDRAYLERWGAELGVLPAVRELLDRVDETA